MAKILIIANFCDGRILRGRFTYLANLLCRQGHEVEIVTSDFSHSKKKAKESFINNFDFEITHIHEPGYPDNISLKRLWSHYIWGRNVYKYLKASEKQWEVIYCAVPSLTVTRLAGKFAKKHRIRFITDVQDLWPEAFAIAVKNKYFSKLLFSPFVYYVNSGYSRADAVIGVSDTYRDRGLLPTRKGCIGLTVYLGNDGEIFDDAKEKYKITRSDDEFWVAYIGTLGYSYDLKCVIKAISILNELTISKRIRFVVMGDGSLKNEFERYAASQGILYTFCGSLPYPEMVGRLCACDIAVNPIVKNSAASIINKVGDYALAGMPVINTQENKEYRKLLEEYQCGINCEVGNASGVAEAIKTLILNEELRKQMGENSRRLGLERFDRRITYQRIAELIKTITYNFHA